MECPQRHLDLSRNVLDTNTDAVLDAAADELISVFRQSSVLIQENPTKTEFYAGK